MSLYTRLLTLIALTGMIISGPALAEKRIARDLD